MKDLNKDLNYIKVLNVQIGGELLEEIKKMSVKYNMPLSASAKHLMYLSLFKENKKGVKENE